VVSAEELACKDTPGLKHVTLVQSYELVFYHQSGEVLVSGLHSYEGNGISM